MCWMLIRLEFNKQRIIPAATAQGRWVTRIPNIFLWDPFKKTTELLWFGEYGDNYSKRNPHDDFWCVLGWPLFLLELIRLQNTKLECFGAICWIHDQYQGLPKISPKKKHRVSNWKITWAVSEKNTFVTSYFSFYWLLERWILIVMVVYNMLIKCPKKLGSVYISSPI